MARSTIRSMVRGQAGLSSVGRRIFAGSSGGSWPVMAT